MEVGAYSVALCVHAKICCELSPAFYTEKKRFNFDNPVAKHCDFTSSMKSLGNSFAHLRDCRFPFCAGHKRFLGLFVSFFFFTFTLFIKIPLGLVLISPNS